MTLALVLLAGVAFQARDAAAQGGPRATVSPTSGTVGSTATVTASGFPANVDLVVIFRIGGDPVVAQAKSNAQGGATFTFTVPHAVAGLYELKISTADIGCAPPCPSHVQ